MNLTDVWITPASKTASTDPLEITIHVNEDFVKDKEYEIFYELSIDGKLKKRRLYEGSIKLEEYAYYNLWYYVRVTGYEEYDGFAHYTVKDLSNPIFKLNSPEADSEFLTSKISFEFEVDNIPLDGSYVIDFSLEPLWGYPDLDSQSSIEGEVYTLPVHNNKIYYQFTTQERLNEYKVWAILRKDDYTTAYVAWIDEFTFKWGLPLLLDEDITIFPEPGSVLSDGEVITIEIKNHVPNANKAKIEYQLYSNDKYSEIYNYSEEQGILLSKKGEYTLILHIRVPDYYVYEYYSLPYEVPKNLTGINEMEIEGLGVRDGVIYVPTKEGERVDVYNLQGIKLYSRLAIERMTLIEGMPKNQILIIKTQNAVAKCIINE